MLRSQRREARRRSNHLHTAQGASSVTSPVRNAYTIPPPPSSVSRRKPGRAQTQVPRRRITTVLPPSKRSSSGFAPPRGPLADLTEFRQQGVANRRWTPQCTLGDRWKPRWKPRQMWSVRGLPMSAVALWITK